MESKLIKRRKGSTLVAVLVVMGASLLILGSVLSISTTQTRMLSKTSMGLELVYCIEALLRSGSDQIESTSDIALFTPAVFNTGNNPLTTPSTALLSYASSASHPASLSVTSTELYAGPVYWTTSNSQNTADIVCFGKITGTYQANSNDSAKTVSQYAMMTYQVTDAPFTDFLFFSEHDTANVFKSARTWDGPVHCNGNLRFGAGATQTHSAAVSTAGYLMNIPCSGGGSRYADMNTYYSAIPTNEYSSIFSKLIPSSGTNYDVTFLNAAGTSGLTYKNGSNFYTSVDNGAGANWNGSYPNDCFGNFAKDRWGTYLQTKENGIRRLMCPGLYASEYNKYTTTPTSTLSEKREKNYGTHTLIEPLSTSSDLTNKKMALALAGETLPVAQMDSKLQLIESQKLANKCGLFLKFNTAMQPYPLQEGAILQNLNESYIYPRLSIAADMSGHLVAIDASDSDIYSSGSLDINNIAAARHSARAARVSSGVIYDYYGVVSDITTTYAYYFPFTYFDFYPTDGLCGNVSTATGGNVWTAQCIAGVRLPLYGGNSNVSLATNYTTEDPTKQMIIQTKISKSDATVTSTWTTNAYAGQTAAWDAISALGTGSLNIPFTTSGYSAYNNYNAYLWFCFCSTYGSAGWAKYLTFYDMRLTLADFTPFSIQTLGSGSTYYASALSGGELSYSNKALTDVTATYSTQTAITFNATHGVVKNASYDGSSWTFSAVNRTDALLVIWDTRRRKWVRILDLDANAILSQIPASANGIYVQLPDETALTTLSTDCPASTKCQYVTDPSGAGTTDIRTNYVTNLFSNFNIEYPQDDPIAFGVRLKNASSLTGDFTLVTNGALYLYGNVNTGTRRKVLLAADSISVMAGSLGARESRCSSRPYSSTTGVSITINASLITGATHPGYMIGTVSDGKWIGFSGDKDKGMGDVIRFIDNRVSSATVNGSIAVPYYSKACWEPWTPACENASTDRTFTYYSTYKNSSGVRANVPTAMPYYRSFRKKDFKILTSEQYDSLKTIWNTAANWTSQSTYNTAIGNFLYSLL